MPATPLKDEHCKPCEGGIDPLAPGRIAKLLPQVPAWQLAEDGQAIVRRFTFRGFNQTMGFVNLLAWVANGQGHHPDFTVGFYHCEVRFTTHAIGGLSENDFICAARLDDLLEP
jgi:4a-hydroxytetrahydrobiopterin dehydratase